MSPKPPEDPAGIGFPLGLLALGLLALVLSIAKVQAREMREELQIERRRRDELQEQLAKRERQLDGALERINELAPDPAGE